MVVDSLESADTRAGRTYTIRIVDGLTYNDGVTPVTAEDYVFLSAADLAAVCGPRRKHGRFMRTCGL